MCLLPARIVDVGDTTRKSVFVLPDVEFLRIVTGRQGKERSGEAFDAEYAKSPHRSEGGDSAARRTADRTDSERKHPVNAGAPIKGNRYIVIDRLGVCLVITRGDEGYWSWEISWRDGREPASSNWTYVGEKGAFD
jgi:hypothetical protein